MGLTDVGLLLLNGKTAMVGLPLNRSMTSFYNVVDSNYVFMFSGLVAILNVKLLPAAIT